MRKLIFSISCAVLLVSFFSCKPTKQEPPAGSPVTLETRSIQQNKGTDCDKQPDSLRTDCAIVDFSVPKIQGAGAQDALGKNLTAWVDKFLIRLLIWGDYPETNPSKSLTTVDAAIKRFHAMHDEAAGSVSSGQFIAACTNGELLNDSLYLTMMLDGHAYSGGNHSLNEVAIATFDIKTGKQLTWADLVNDPKALLPIAQANVEETRADAFKEGFKFDTTEPFALPASYGLTADGLLMHYSPDEIYLLGGSTEFTIPYSELGANLKVTAPIAPATEEASTDALDIYEVQGDSLVIPTFEIEVLESVKAAAAMQKKKETAIVSASFAGVPINPKDADEIGEMAILNKEIELTGTDRIARFEGLKFSKNNYDKLAPDDKDISVLVNIFSGRKSSNDNLLACGILEMKASGFKNKRFTLGCKLIEEPEKGGTGMSHAPLACYALPPAGASQNGPLPFLVECSESGQIEWAGAPMKDYDALMDALRPLLVDRLKNGTNELPGLETSGCMMGNSGEIRTRYEELKSEILGKGKTATTTSEKVKSGEAKKPKVGEGKPVKTAIKTAPAPSSLPSVTVNQKGEITLSGKTVKMENLRKDLQNALLAQTIIPDNLEVKSVGEVGMGMRGEVKTLVAEAISGAKWVRKKAAIAALNTSVGKKLGTSSQLELGSYQTNSNFAYISAKPKHADGKAIDYSKTTFSKDFAAGKFADNAIGLLQYENGNWKVLAYNIGAGKPPVDVWVKNYKAPKALFGK